MLHVTNIQMGVRLALLSDDRRSALLFEPARRRRAAAVSGSALYTPAAGGSGPLSSGTATGSSNTGCLPLADAGADVTVRELALSNTLLASAVSHCVLVRVSSGHVCLHVWVGAGGCGG